MLTPGLLTVKDDSHKTPMFFFPTSARLTDQTDPQILVSDAPDVILLFRSSHLSGRDPSMRYLYYIRMVGRVKGDDYLILPSYSRFKGTSPAQMSHPGSRLES